MKNTNFTINYESLKLSQVASIMIDGVGQQALLDSVESSDYEKNKQMLKRLKHLDGDTSKSSFKLVKEFENLLFSFGCWAMNKGYIKSFSLIFLFYNELKSMIYEIDNPLKNTQENVQNHLLFSIRNILIRFFTDMNENYPNDSIIRNWSDTLSTFDVWGVSTNYTEDIFPIKSAFEYLKWMANDKKKVEIEWDKLSNDTNLYTKIERWCSGKQRPSWNELKLFLDVQPYPTNAAITEFEKYKESEISKDFYNAFKDVMSKPRTNLHLSDKLLENPAEGIFNGINWTYPSFSNALFISYFVTNVADSMENQKLISKDFRNMIRNGLRLFYRDFFSDSLSRKNNEYQDNIMYMILTDGIYYGKISKHPIYKKSKVEKQFRKYIGKPFNKKLTEANIIERYSRNKIGESYVFFQNWKLGELYIQRNEIEKAIPFFIEAFEKGRYFAGIYMKPFLFEAINYSAMTNEKKTTIRRMVEFAEILFPNGPYL